MANLSRLPTPLFETYEWQFDGACNEAEPELFFSADALRGPRRRQREAQAKAYCDRCPVFDKCRDHALSVQEPYGVWGGLTPAERHILTAERSAS
ncbi:MAG: transcription factor WhiB [Nocardioidaceae bacterium]|nr:transcription factor WhiB [Nocardioidaceae bacterium]